MRRKKRRVKGKEALKERKQRMRRRRGRRGREGRKRRKKEKEGSGLLTHYGAMPESTRHKTRPQHCFPPRQSAKLLTSCLLLGTDNRHGKPRREEAQTRYSREMLQKHQPDTLQQQCARQHGRENATCPHGHASLFLSIPFVKKVIQENRKGSQGWCESGTRHHLFSSLTAGKSITCPWCCCRGHSGPDRTCRRGQSCLLGFLCWDSPSTHRHPITELEHQLTLPMNPHTTSHLEISAQGIHSTPPKMISHRSRCGHEPPLQGISNGEYVCGTVVGKS